MEECDICNNKFSKEELNICNGNICVDMKCPNKFCKNCGITFLYSSNHIKRQCVNCVPKHNSRCRTCSNQFDKLYGCNYCSFYAGIFRYNCGEHMAILDNNNFICQECFEKFCHNCKERKGEQCDKCNEHVCQKCNNTCTICVNKLTTQIKNLESENQKLKEYIRLHKVYMPGGEGEEEAKKDFEEQLSKIN